MYVKSKGKNQGQVKDPKVRHTDSVSDSCQLMADINKKNQKTKAQSRHKTEKRKQPTDILV